MEIKEKFRTRNLTIFNNSRITGVNLGGKTPEGWAAVPHSRDAFKMDICEGCEGVG
jgi:hypothetical protein